MATKNKTDFLQFNAYQIKDTILRKLSEDSKFTDQVYEGSNLSILIDIVSYMLQGLLYSLNTAAAESMFADTQFYENINRLCQFLGYSPHGCAPAMAEFIQAIELNDVQHELLNNRVLIPRYSYVSVGKTTPNGESIYYSVGSNEIRFDSDAHPKIVLYNGKWKLYKSALVTTGEDWETFTLDLRSDYNAKKYVPHGFIDIYAKVAEGETGSKWYHFTPVDTQLFRQQNTIASDLNTNLSQINKILYTGSLASGEINNTNSDSALRSGQVKSKDTVFNLRLDENKRYVITFGDGVTAAKLPPGSILYIVYLESAGPGAELVPGEANEVNIIKPTALDLPDDLWDAIITDGLNNQTIDNSCNICKYTNVSPSTPYVKEETVEEIRRNAPNWFRASGRLVTKSDYENFFRYTPILNASVSDIKCQNNWEYTTTFYKWLYDLGRTNHNDPKYYLNQNNLIKARYQNSDAADCNNVYLWYRPAELNTSMLDSNKTKDIQRYIYPIKDITHEPIPCPGIPVSFVVTAAPPDKIKSHIEKYNYYTNNFDTTTDTYSSYVEVLIDDNIMFAPTVIASMITEKIRTFFEDRQRGLGISPDFSELMASVYEINGILRVRTIFYDNKKPEEAIIYNGLSFASWSIPANGLLEICEDLQISPNTRSLEIFQYPVYNYDSTGGNNTNRYAALKDQFKVIKRSGSPLEVVAL